MKKKRNSHWTSSNCFFTSFVGHAVSYNYQKTLKMKFPMDDVVISNSVCWKMRISILIYKYLFCCLKKKNNQYYQIKFSGTTGHITKITNVISKISSAIDQQFFWYNSSAGNNRNSSQVQSGNVIFWLMRSFLQWCLIIFIHYNYSVQGLTYFVQTVLRCSLLILTRILQK